MHDLTDQEIELRGNDIRDALQGSNGIPALLDSLVAEGGYKRHRGDVPRTKDEIYGLLSRHVAWIEKQQGHRFETPQELEAAIEVAAEFHKESHVQQLAERAARQEAREAVSASPSH